jgi:hypothetical protein
MAPAEPAPVEANPPTSTQEIATPDEHRERVIASLGQLLSSGRPLSDLLDEAKRLAASFSEPTGSNGSEPKDAIALLGKSAHHAAAPERNADIHTPLNPSWPLLLDGTKSVPSIRPADGTNCFLAPSRNRVDGTDRGIRHATCSGDGVRQAACDGCGLTCADVDGRAARKTA